jgi:hypothetical protein
MNYQKYRGLKQIKTASIMLIVCYSILIIPLIMGSISYSEGTNYYDIMWGLNMASKIFIGVVTVVIFSAIIVFLVGLKKINETLPYRQRGKINAAFGLLLSMLIIDWILYILSWIPVESSFVYAILTFVVVILYFVFLILFNNVTKTLLEEEGLPSKSLISPFVFTIVVCYHFVGLIFKSINGAYFYGYPIYAVYYYPQAVTIAFVYVVQILECLFLIIFYSEVLKIFNGILYKYEDQVYSDSTHYPTGRVQPVSSVTPRSAATISSQTSISPVRSVSDKDKTTTLLLAIFAGGLGVHRFYVGKALTGVLYLFTGGLFSIGVLVDVILLATDKFTDSEGKLITDKDIDSLKQGYRPSSSRATQYSEQPQTFSSQVSTPEDQEALKERLYEELPEQFKYMGEGEEILIQELANYYRCSTRLIEDVIKELLNKGVIMGSLNPFKGRFTVKKDSMDGYQW